MPIIDARGIPFTPYKRPVRVLSLVPSITELLFDLGLGESEIVGRTRFCVHPKEGVNAIPSVGGTKGFSLEKVLALAPSLVIANIDENRKEEIEAIERAPDAPAVFVTQPNSFDQAVDMIGSIGRLLSAGVLADAMVHELISLRNSLHTRHRGDVLYLIWREPYMTVSDGTYIADILRQLGYRNCVDAAFLEGKAFASEGAARYPAITPEEIVSLRPQTILFSSEPYPFSQKHIDELTALLAAIDPAYTEHVDMRLIDGEYYSWYGSRMVKAFRHFVDEQQF